MLRPGKRLAAAVILCAVIAAAISLSQNKSCTRPSRQEVLISFAGDILLDRGVADAIEKNGMAYPYAEVSELFQQDDITIANLECPLTRENHGAMKEPKFVFKADQSNADSLKAAGIDVLTLANNHTMDYLSKGLWDTMEALDGAGLLYAGAGEDAQEIKPCFIEKNGLRIGILSYSSLPPEGFMYDDQSATIAYARAGFLDSMQENVAEAAARCDFLIVCFHWGTEYRHDVGELQKEIAHAAVDSGAAAVIGTHPHVLQGRETYKDAPIYYSIGNFVFDKQIPEGTDEALILQLLVGKNGVISIHELPVIIKSCQPRLAVEEKAAQILADLKRYSRQFE